MSQCQPADPYYSFSFPHHNFDQFDLVRYPVAADMNCFFNSLMLSFDRNYRMETDKTIRYNSVMAIRRYISDQLPTLYHKLSRGELAEYAKAVGKYKVEELQHTIKNTECVGLEVMELTSIILDINIVILDAKTKDVYMTGDYELLHRDGKSYVVIIYYEDNVHYELCGLKTNQGIVTYFSEGHTFIKHILRRIKSKTN